MNSPKISLIVPVYNTERFMCKCLDSILSQTFRDWEAILVDDGSTDKSGVICDEYAKKDGRFVVIHKENGGVSNARQSGLNRAEGDYVIHADPDDWMESNMLEDMYSSAIKFNSDLVYSDFYKETNGKAEYVSQKITVLDSNTFLKGLFTNIYGACWNKLIRRSCIQKYKARFPEGWSLREDLYFLTTLLVNEIRISYVNKAYYHYVIGHNANSLSTSKRMPYDYYTHLYSTFSELTKNSPNYRLVQSLYAFRLIENEYVRNEDTSYEFSKKCLPYCVDMLKSEKPLNIKILYTLSCLGGYRLLRYLLEIKRNINIKK